MKAQRILITVLLLLLGMQSALSNADFDVHTDSEISCDASALLSVDSDTCSDGLTDTSTQPDACDHCGDCCHCHSNVFIKPLYTFYLGQKSVASTLQYYSHYFSYSSSNLFRPPIA
jgi:hypothetical protein